MNVDIEKAVNGYMVKASAIGWGNPTLHVYDSFAALVDGLAFTFCERTPGEKAIITIEKR